MAKTSEVERSETRRTEKIFWQDIKAIRQEELPKLYAEEFERSETRRAISLETQIQSTILTTIFFYGELRAHLKMDFRTLKKMKNHHHQAPMSPKSVRQSPRPTSLWLGSS